jgi:hypothetical protein
MIDVFASVDAGWIGLRFTLIHMIHAVGGRKARL